MKQSKILFITMLNLQINKEVFQKVGLSQTLYVATPSEDLHI